MPSMDLMDPAPATAGEKSGLTPADLRNAALAVCSNSTDADEAREFLGMLGLLDTQPPRRLCNNVACRQAGPHDNCR